MTTSQRVRRLFALPHRHRRLVPIAPSILEAAVPAAGQITLLSGPSGGGKSRLLRALRENHRRRSVQWIDPSKIILAEVSVVDCVCDALDPADAGDERGIACALELLSRVGLAEAWTYLQKPSELSDGQRWRLLLAMAVAGALHARRRQVVTVIAMDEFAALLDRVTARIVARALRRLVDRHIGERRPMLGAIVATSHHDLIAALQPEIIINCDFGVYEISARSSRDTTAP